MSWKQLYLQALRESGKEKLPALIRFLFQNRRSLFSYESDLISCFLRTYSKVERETGYVQ
jgi:hypothetical protein